MNRYILHDLLEFGQYHLMNGVKYREGFNFMNMGRSLSILTLKMTSITQILRWKTPTSSEEVGLSSSDLIMPFCYTNTPILFDITKACRCPPDHDWSGYEFATYTIYPNTSACITLGQILETIIQNNLNNNEIIKNDPEIDPILDFQYIERIRFKNGNPQHLIIPYYGN